MKRLKEWLSETGTTQAGLALSVGVSQPTVSDWVNGETFPTTRKLRRLSAATGISIDELLTSSSRSRDLRPDLYPVERQ